VFLNSIASKLPKNLRVHVSVRSTWRSVRRFLEKRCRTNSPKELYCAYLPAIACSAPPRTPPVNTPAMAPTGATGVMESFVFDFVDG